MSDFVLRSVNLGEATVEAVGVEDADLAPHRAHDWIRRVDIASTDIFVRDHAFLLTGRVLDFGAGVDGSCRNPQPYRALVERPGVEYFPADLASMPGRDYLDLHIALMDAGPFDSILCTQVFQYFEDAGAGQLQRFRCFVPPGSRLVMTYATNWDEVERSDRFRCTRAGMELQMTRAGWVVEEHVLRSSVRIGSFRFPIGYGLVARAL